jgi:hypothetical protein
MKCEMKGCAFPAMIVFRDINRDVNVCRQHSDYFREERGNFSDGPIELARTEEVEHKAKKVSTRVYSNAEGRTVDDLLTIIRITPAPSRSNRRASSRLRTFAAAQQKRRTREAERDTYELSMVDLKERLKALETLYKLRRDHQRRLCKDAARRVIAELWVASKQSQLVAYAESQRLVAQERKRKAADAVERRKQRQLLKPPKWVPYLEQLERLEIGESCEIPSDGGVNFSSRLRAMMAQSKRTYKWQFKTKLIGEMLHVVKVDYWFASVQ